MNICLPAVVLEPIMPKIDSQDWFIGAKKVIHYDNEVKLRKLLSKSVINLTGELGNSKLSIRDLLKPANYARYRLCLKHRGDTESLNTMRHYPCFRFQLSGDTELLWGATYRIVTIFLDYIFGFKPPDPSEIPIIEGSLDQNYLTGHK